MKQKELDKEGITKELLSTISVKNLGNPVQLLPNDEPVNLVKCMNGFWVSIDGQLVKDEKNNYLVVSEKEAIIGRARYLLNFEEEIKKREGLIYQKYIDSEISKEIIHLKNITKIKVEKYLSEVKTILQLAGLISEEDFSFTLKKALLSERGKLEEATNEAKDIVSQKDYHYSYDVIKKWLDNENYDDLYSYFFQNGSYQIAEFDNKSIDVMIKFFHRDKLEKTIEEIGRNSHLENVAKFNVEKRIKLIKSLLKIQ